MRWEVIHLKHCTQRRVSRRLKSTKPSHHHLKYWACLRARPGQGRKATIYHCQQNDAKEVNEAGPHQPLISHTQMITVKPVWTSCWKKLNKCNPDLHSLINLINQSIFAVGDGCKISLIVIWWNQRARRNPTLKQKYYYTQQSWVKLTH